MHLSRTVLSTFSALFCFIFIIALREVYLFHCFIFQMEKLSMERINTQFQVIGLVRTEAGIWLRPVPESVLLISVIRRLNRLSETGSHRCCDLGVKPFQSSGYESESESYSVVSDSLQPHGLYTVHGILQARILGWVAFPFSRGSSQPRDRTQVCHIAGGFSTSWATREAHAIQ